jgi:hypothetical protein
VLFKSFRYSVVAAYLLRRDSGLLLRSISNSPRFNEHGVSYAGMVAALRDFAVDCFKGESRATAESADTFSFRYQDYSCVTGSTKNYTLAILYHGEGGSAVKDALRKALVEIRESPIQPMRGSIPELSSFEPFDPILRRCLISEPVPAKVKGSARWVRIAAVCAVLLAAIGLGVRHFVRVSRGREAAFAEWRKAVRNRTDLAIDDVDRDTTVWRVLLRRDPESTDAPPPLPKNLTGRVRITYQDAPILNEAMTGRRLNRVLNPPPTVRLALNNGNLLMTGEAAEDWTARARIAAPLVPGVTAVDAKGLESFEQRRFSDLTRAVYHEPSLAGRDAAMAFIRSKLDDFVEIDRLARLLGYEYYHCLTVQGDQRRTPALLNDARAVSGLMEWALHERGVIAIWPVRIIKLSASAKDASTGIGVSVVASSSGRWISRPPLTKPEGTSQ